METKSAYTAFRRKAKTTRSSARRGLLSRRTNRISSLAARRNSKANPTSGGRGTRAAQEERGNRIDRRAADASASLPMRGRARHDRARRSAT
jgi:hypothetical protein